MSKTFIISGYYGNIGTYILNYLYKNYKDYNIIGIDNQCLFINNQHINYSNFPFDFEFYTNFLSINMDLNNISQIVEYLSQEFKDKKYENNEFYYFNCSYNFNIRDKLKRLEYNSNLFKNNVKICELLEIQNFIYFNHHPIFTNDYKILKNDRSDYLEDNMVNDFVNFYNFYSNNNSKICFYNIKLYDLYDFEYGNINKNNNHDDFLLKLHQFWFKGHTIYLNEIYHKLNFLFTNTNLFYEKIDYIINTDKKNDALEIIDVRTNPISLQLKDINEIFLQLNNFNCDVYCRKIKKNNDKKYVFSHKFFI